jgi:hypothetical protein
MSRRPELKLPLWYTSHRAVRPGRVAALRCPPPRRGGATAGRRPGGPDTNDSVLRKANFKLVRLKPGSDIKACGCRDRAQSGTTMAQRQSWKSNLLLGLLPVLLWC